MAYVSRWHDLHVVLELLQVLVLLCQLLLELHKLLLLTHADGIVLVGLLALGECVSGTSASWSSSVAAGHGSSGG